MIPTTRVTRLTAVLAVGSTLLAGLTSLGHQALARQDRDRLARELEQRAWLEVHAFALRDTSHPFLPGR